MESDTDLVASWLRVVEALSGHSAVGASPFRVAEHTPEVEVLEPREGESEKSADEDKP